MYLLFYEERGQAQRIKTHHVLLKKY